MYAALRRTTMARQMQPHLRPGAHDGSDEGGTLLVAEPSGGVAPSAVPRPLSHSLAGSLGGSTTEARSQSPTEELLRLLSRERLDYGLSPGLRQLAERFAYGALGLLFPHFASRAGAGRDELADELATLKGVLQQALAAPDSTEESDAARSAAVEYLFSGLGAIREAVLLDARAIYAGDPAAESVDEVILAYPGFLATPTYRIAHELYGRVSRFPRLLTEVAHRATGIDIHPGARIGPSFGGASRIGSGSR